LLLRGLAKGNRLQTMVASALLIDLYELTTPQASCSAISRAVQIPQSFGAGQRQLFFERQFLPSRSLLAGVAKPSKECFDIHRRCAEKRVLFRQAAGFKSAHSTLKLHPGSSSAVVLASNAFVSRAAAGLHQPPTGLRLRRAECAKSF
jgi:hypothetical protein